MSRRQIEVAVLIAVVVLLLVIFSPGIQSARHTSRRVQSKNNLMQLGLALSSYHDTYRVLPPGGTFHADGRGHHGWMTSILPNVDVAPVFHGIDFNLPWDSAANAGIFTDAHAGYQSPSVELVPNAWEFSPAHYSANSHLLGPNSAVKLDDIPGRSSTMLVGELRTNFVPWGSPYNSWPVDSVNDQGPYGRPDQKGWIAVLADGNVRELSATMSPELLESLNGPDLANSAKASVKRPPHFTVPADALKRRIEYAGQSPTGGQGRYGNWRFLYIDRDGRVVRSEVRAGN